MRKSLPAALLGLLVAFLAVGLWKSCLRNDIGTAGRLAPAPRSAEPGEFWSAFRRATELRSEEKFLAAAEWYQKALQLRPDHEESLYYYGNCLLEIGDALQARTVFERILERNPRSLRGLSQLGVTLSTLQPGAPIDVEGARLAFQKTMELAPDESGPFVRLGLLALQHNRLQEAILPLDTAARFQTPEAIFWRGYLHFQQEEFEEAARRFHQVLEMAAAETRLAKKGAVSEGVTSTAGKEELSTLQSARIQARLYLFWTARQLEGYPLSIPAQFRIEKDLKGFASRPAIARAGTTISPTDEQRGRPRWIDYDTDGDADLVVSLADGIELFQNRRGSLKNRSLDVGLGDIAGAWDSCWGDVDGDGRPDLYLVRSGWIGSAQNTLLLNRPPTGPGGALFVDATEKSGLSGVRSTSVAGFFDLDGDGDMDLVEGGNAGGPPSLRVFRNQGSGHFAADTDGVPEFEGHVVDIQVADIDQDDDLDLVVLRWGRPALLLENDGNAGFVDATAGSGLESAGGSGYSALLLDIDRDELPDLLVSRRSSYPQALRSLLETPSPQAARGLQLFWNVGGGKFADGTPQAGLSGALGVMQLAAGDFNGDGWLDVVAAAGGLESTWIEPARIYWNQEGQAFVPGPFVPGLAEPVNSLGVAAADTDGDGRAEGYLSPGGLFAWRGAQR